MDAREETITGYIRMLHSIIRRLGIPPHRWDEAASQGLVYLAEALRDFQPERGVPEQAWVAQQLRIDLRGWMKSEIKHNALPILDGDNPFVTEAAIIAELDEIDLMAEIEAAIELVLDEREAYAIRTAIYRRHQAEVSRKLKLNAIDLSILRYQAGLKLRAALSGIGVFRGINEATL